MAPRLNRYSAIYGQNPGENGGSSSRGEGGGGGGTPLYQLYRYVPPQRVWFLSRYGLKTGKD